MGGGRRAVLLHGFGADRLGWAFNQKAVAALADVAVPDLPGHGQSVDAFRSGDRETLLDQVTAIIDNGKYPDGSPLAGQPTKPAVLAVFTEYLGLDGQTDDEKMDSIENYLWSNVERMRQSNFYITDAPGRPVMPQTSRSTFQPVLGLMQGPSPLSYSFPIISYLG